MGFDEAILKIERAKKHINDAETVILGLKNGYVSSIESHGDLGCSIKYECPRFSERTTEIALITGDAIHNLRSALDYAWVSVIEKFALPVGRWTKFPFSATEKGLCDVLVEQKVGGPSAPLFQKIITDVKPYRGGDFFLWALHRADITDKHKLILPVIDHTAVRDIVVEDQNGQPVKGDTWGLVGTGGFFRVDLAPNIKVKNQGYVPISIHLHEGSDLDGFSIPEDLLALAWRVHDVVELLRNL